MAEVVVAIFYKRGEQGEPTVPTVWPPYVVVKPGDEVVFKTVDTEATVILKPANLFDGGTGTEITVNLARESAARKKVKGDGKTAFQAGKLAYTVQSAPPGVYEYKVVCNGINVVVNSTPVMIIEPPGP